MKLNKSNIFTILALGGLMVCTPVLRADDTNSPATPPPAHGRGGAGMQKMIDSLGLTDEQKPQVMAALKDRREKMMALRDDTSVTGDDRKTKMKAIVEATNAKLKTILTPDQFTKFEAAQKNLRGNRPGAGPAAAASIPDAPTK